jgi:cytidylate kinase
MVIAIDGPAGAGKSTVARALARELGFTYLDSGAMYRSVGLLSLQDPDAEPAALAAASEIVLVSTPDGERVLLDGRDVTAQIRTPAVSEAASRVATDPAVRGVLVDRQRGLLASGDWVAEGRDIGTIVAPDADVKVFLTADPAVRAHRRAEELGGDEATVAAEQAARDERDRTRAASPLRPAPGAFVLDTTSLSVQQAVGEIARRLHETRSAGEGLAR